MRPHIAFVVFGLTLVVAAPAAAQWDAPSFFAPRPGEDLGLYAVNPEGGAGWGLAAIWRQEGKLSLGVRAAIADNDIIHIGSEFYGPLRVLGPQSQLMIDWIAGLGASFNGVTHLRVPVGVSLGLNLGSRGGMMIKPYAHPRVALDVFAYDNARGDEETETEVNVDLDLGADVALGQSFVLRGGITFSLSDDGRNTFGAGIAYRMPRRVTVR